MSSWHCRNPFDKQVVNDAGAGHTAAWVILARLKTGGNLLDARDEVEQADVGSGASEPG